MQQSINTQGKVTWSDLVTPIFYKPIIISVTMRFLQQMTGITPVLVFLEFIFSKHKVSLAPKLDLPSICLYQYFFHVYSSNILLYFVRYDAALVGAVRLFSVAVAATLMDKAGRKALLYTSSMLMFVSTLTLTLISHNPGCPPSPTPNITDTLNYSSHNPVGVTAAGLLPLISIMVFIFGKYLGNLLITHNISNRFRTEAQDIPFCLLSLWQKPCLAFSFWWWWAVVFASIVVTLFLLKQTLTSKHKSKGDCCKLLFVLSQQVQTCCALGS